MSSKIKSASAMSSVAGRTRASSLTCNRDWRQQHPQSASPPSVAMNTNSDTEDEPSHEQDASSSRSGSANNDSNNNDLENNNQQKHVNQLAGAQQSQQTSSKKSQDKLMDIVEVSRKRRLSEDSAESLSSFIRWSFGHLPEQQQQQQQQYPKQRRGSFSAPAKHSALVMENNNNSSMKNLARAGQHEEDELLDDEDEDWSTLSQRRNSPLQQPAGNKFQMADQLLLLRQQAKLAAAGSSAMNLQRQQQEALRSANKRPKSNIYSPEAKPFSNMHASHLQHQQQQQTTRKVSSYLGSVVDRLHQQKLQASPTSARQSADATDSEPPQEANSGLTFHLQQFLSQQTSLEDLCSSVGLDDNTQLVLAAAIHRALADSQQQPPPPADSKSTASSTGGSSSGGSSSLAAQGQSATTTPSAPSNLVEALQGAGRFGARRAYNTRNAGNLAAGTHQQQLQQQQPARQPAGNSANSTSAALAALNINSRLQQHLHAQAAAALSALASAGNHHHQTHGNTGQHHQHHHSAHQLLSGGLANVVGNHNQQPPTGGLPVLPAGGGAAGNPLVDFECDTCGSRFDDRHRLMQHQSIHLELKKAWFKETPVDEVMKIFNRRRGEFLCNACNLRFEATLDYDQHNHQVHGPRPYCCQFCGNGTRTFKCWRQYLNHLYDHRYVFSCTIGDCDFTVNRRDSLRFHIFRFHLNCQLPQNQLVTPTNGLGLGLKSGVQLSPYNLTASHLAGGGGYGDHESAAHQFVNPLLSALHNSGSNNNHHHHPHQLLRQKWSQMVDDEDEADPASEINVAD